MQKTIQQHTLIIGILLLFFVSCDPQDIKLTLVNTTKDTVFYSLADSDSITNSPVEKVGAWIDYGRSYYIMPFNDHHSACMDKWEYVINSSKDSSLRIFFFSNNLIKNASRDSLMTNQLYSKRIKLKVQDLERLNWKVIYTGK